MQTAAKRRRSAHSRVVFERLRLLGPSLLIAASIGPLFAAVDSVKPTVSITAPTANQRITNASFFVQGTAKDNQAIDSVWYQLNGGALATASTSNGWFNWSAKVTLDPGTNILRAFAIDATGNRSATNTRTVTYVVLAPLAVVIAGRGSVELWSQYENFWDRNLRAKIVVPGTASSIQSNLPAVELGRAYTLLAKPAANWFLSNWSGGVVSDNPVLAFTMQPGLRLQANFVTNPFAPFRGDYKGLFYTTNRVTPTNSGAVGLTVRENGAYTGALTIGKDNFAISGLFNGAGHALAKVVRLVETYVGGGCGTYTPPTRKVSTSLTAELQLEFGPRQEVRGSITDGSWFAPLRAGRSIYDGKTKQAPQAGNYTMIIKGAPGSPSSPGGDGFGTVVVNSKGAISFQGTLAEGSKIEQKTALAKGSEWPLFASVQSGQGILIGWINFADEPSSDFSAPSIHWVKAPNTKNKLYPKGFATETTIVGSRYTTPTTTMNLLGWSNGVIVVNGVGLNGALAANFQIQTNYHGVFSPTNTNTFTLNFNVAQGLHTGSFRLPGSKVNTPFQGAVLQKSAWGSGFYVGSASSEWVQLLSSEVFRPQTLNSPAGFPRFDPTFSSKVVARNANRPLLEFDRALEPTSMPPRPILREPTITDDKFRFTLATEPGQAYVLQTSTDLRNWSDVTHFVAADRMTFLEAARTNAPAQFFRVFILPTSP